MFQRGNKLGKGRPRNDSPKTIWLLQSLASNGVDLQDLLAKSILKASHGDVQALEFASLLTKLLPHVVNAPKASSEMVNIESLVINRFNKSTQSEAIATEVINTDSLTDGPSASLTDGHHPDVLNNP